MARSAQGWGFGLRSLAGAALVAGVGLTGCNKHDDSEAARPAVETPTSAEATKDKPSTVAVSKESAPFGDSDTLHQPFAKAAFSAMDLPPSATRPPDETITGKPTHALLRQVKALWEAIRFTSPDGRRIAYTAIVETDKGVIEIELRPDVAPNHVRSFVALATAGYYDDLPFDHIRVEEAVKMDGTPDVRLEQIEGGNPRGSEDVNGTIGYWLRLEPSTKLTHEEGTVGSCLEGGPESDGCRFYINLSKAAYLDGNFTAFGKVKTGLDVARRIFAQPVVNEDRERDGQRHPMKPAVIKKVTIQTRDAGATEEAK